MKQPNLTPTQMHIIFLFVGFLVFIWSYFDHYDTFGWFVLSMVVVLGVVFFASTYKKFTFSTFVYFFILIWMIILMIGAKHTYSNNPTFDMISDTFNLSRNYYDRVGHLAQGFIPVMIIKEFLYRKNILKPSKMSVFLIVCLVLSFGALYEILEFAAVEITNQPASYILDTQGHNWDTHWDMVMAVLGASVSLLFLGKSHDKYIDIMREKDRFKI